MKNGKTLKEGVRNECHVEDLHELAVNKGICKKNSRNKRPRLINNVRLI